MVHHALPPASPRRPLHHLRARREGDGRGAEGRPGGSDHLGGDSGVSPAGRGRIPAAEPARLSHPAVMAAILAAAAPMVPPRSVAIFVPDLFQHLLVGKAIWQLRAVPQQHLWTWPSYGVSEVLPSWLFRALVWPFWSVGGVWGLFAWRWLTTLLAFGLAWAAAR